MSTAGRRQTTAWTHRCELEEEFRILFAWTKNAFGSLTWTKNAFGSVSIFTFIIILSSLISVLVAIIIVGESKGTTNITKLIYQNIKMIKTIIVAHAVLCQRKHLLK